MKKLVKQIAKEEGMKQVEVDRIVRSMFKLMRTTFEAGEKKAFRVRGLGIFKYQSKKEPRKREE